MCLDDRTEAPKWSRGRHVGILARCSAGWPEVGMWLAWVDEVRSYAGIRASLVMYEVDGRCGLM